MAETAKSSKKSNTRQRIRHHEPHSADAHQPSPNSKWAQNRCQTVSLGVLGNKSGILGPSSGFSTAPRRTASRRCCATSLRSAVFNREPNRLGSESKRFDARMCGWYRYCGLGEVWRPLAETRRSNDRESFDQSRCKFTVRLSRLFNRSNWFKPSKGARDDNS